MALTNTHVPLWLYKTDSLEYAVTETPTFLRKLRKIRSFLANHNDHDSNKSPESSVSPLGLFYGRPHLYPECQTLNKVHHASDNWQCGEKLFGQSYTTLHIRRRIHSAHIGGRRSLHQQSVSQDQIRPRTAFARICRTPTEEKSLMPGYAPRGRRHGAVHFARLGASELQLVGAQSDSGSPSGARDRHIPVAKPHTEQTKVRRKTTGTGPPDGKQTEAKKSRKISAPGQLSRRFLAARNDKGATAETPEERRENVRRRLRSYFRLARGMHRLLENMKELSKRLTEKTAVSELYHYSASGTVNDENLQDTTSGTPSFDRTRFSRKASVQSPLWARAIAEKRPEHRTQEELQRLYKILNLMKAFQEKFTEDMKWKLCHMVRYISCEQRRVILRQGQMGHNFYFIYSGSVFIQKQIQDPTSEKEVTSTENIMNQGMSFGELALLSGKGLRTASVICREQTELFYVDKVTFMEICPGIFLDELELKISVAKTHEMFSTWKDTEVRDLCFQSHLVTVPYGKVLERDWSHPKYVYFIIKGQVLLLRELDLTEDDFVQNNQENHKSPHGETKLERQNKRLKMKGNAEPKFVSVGVLETGEHSELLVLRTDKPKDVSPVIMVSQGVKVLRMSLQMIDWMAPKILLDEYLRHRYNPHISPDQDVLRRYYLQHVTWNEYKERVLTTLRREQNGEFIAHIPATQKDLSAISRWQGPRVKKKCHKIRTDQQQHVGSNQKSSCGTTALDILNGKKRALAMKDHDDTQDETGDDYRTCAPCGVSLKNDRTFVTKSASRRHPMRSNRSS